MPEERRQDDLLHIAIEREPDIEAERRRRGPPPPPPRVAGRSQHGSRIASDVSSIAEAVRTTRQQAGLDPARFLVLEFTSWDAGARDVFETQLNATVVDERSETRRVTRIIAVPPRHEDIDTVVRRIEAAGTGRREAPSAAEPLRLRRAKQDDLDKAKRTGATIPDELASRPSDLVVVNAVDWTPEAENSLRDLGLSPVATMQETTEVTRVLVVTVRATTPCRA